MSREQWLQSCPELTPEGELALAVWDFCGRRWDPNAVPLAAAYFGVEDLSGLIERLLAIRGRVDEHLAVQRAALQAAQGRR